VFAAWISFQATSLISIDNIGVSIWGWILGGLLIAFNGIQTEDTVKSGASKNSNLESIQPLLGILLIIPILIFISMLYKVESQVYKSRLFASVSQESFSGQSNAQVLSTSQLPLLDSNYQLNLASYLANKGEFTQAISLLTRTIEENPRNQDAYSLLAFIYEQTGEFKLAIGVRNSITKLDPWDANNYLDLGLLHRSLGENDEANTYFNRILDFADKTPVGDEARKFLQE
jgi:tetratricopeptide (TPR) repeat protein